MKKLFTLLLLAVTCLLSLAQTSNIPDLVNFQGIARDVNGNLVVSQTIQVQITILEGTSLPGATALYRELHQPITDVFGAFQIVLNENTSFVNPIVFTFANIPWNTGNKWAKIEYQTSLGGSLIELATLKLTSSFYAFASRTTEKVNNVTLSPAAIGQVLKYNGSQWVPAADETIDGDASSTNELQSLSISGTALSLSQGGGTVSVGPKVAVLTEQKANNVSGGTFVAGQWITRELNTVEPANNGFISLNPLHQFTLQPGQYSISASAPAYSVDKHVIKLRDVTNATDKIVGRCAFSNDATYAQTDSDLSGIISINSPTTFEIQHGCIVTSVGSDGLGLGTLGMTNLGLISGTQTFTVVEITKLD